MTSRLFWKLFLTFSLVHLAVIVGATKLFSKPAAVGTLQLYALTDDREETLIPLALEDAGEMSFELSAQGSHHIDLSAKEDGNAVIARRDLPPGRYRLKIRQPPTPSTELIWIFASTAFAGLFAITLWLVIGVVRPVRKLTQSADEMASGQYAEPIYVANRDELGRLASSFNRMREKMGRNLAKIRDTNQRMATVLGGMTDGVIAINERQQVLFANRAAGELLDFVPAAAQGKTLLETVRSHALHDLVVRLSASHGQQEIEIDWEADDTRNLLISATSFSGEPSAGIVMMIHNLTEERRLESMRRDFVANVSHELKTPLSSIKAYAETLSQGAIEDADNRGQFVRQIEEQADRLNQLITDLLSLARIEQASENVELNQIPVGKVVALCVHEQRRAAAEKGIQLTVDAGGDEIVVNADEDGLRQMLINLIDNAIKYTPPDGRVTITWSQDPARVTLSVSDTGIGIAEDLQPRVFERFFRVDKARSRELGGTGLGLAIVKHLAHSFRGSVEVKSQIGKGSTFTVHFPVPSLSG